MNRRALWLTQLLLFGSLVASTAIYCVVLYVVARSGPPPMPEPPQPLALALAAAALAVGAAAFVLRGRLMPPLGDVMPGAGDDDAPLDDAERAAAQRLATVLIITWALSEAIAIFGLVLGFLTHRLEWFWPFWGASLVSFALHRPDRARLDGVLAGAHQPQR